MTSIETLMRDSNPMMDPSTDFSEDEIQAFDLLVRTRSGNMDVQELTKQVEPEKKQRSGWLVAAVSFAVVIVFFGAAMLLARPAEELPPATTPPTTQAAPPTTEAAVVEEVEEAAVTTTVPAAVGVSVEDQAVIDELLVAFNASDGEAVLALMSPSAKIRSYVVLDARPDFWSNELAWRWALNEQWDIGGCEVSLGANTCQMTVTGGWAGPLGTQDATLRVVIADGVISALTVKEDLAFLVPAAADMAAWLEAEHPEAVSIMLAAGGDPRPPKLTEESIALWVELVPVWHATLDE